MFAKYRAYRAWQVLRAAAIWRSIGVECTFDYANKPSRYYSADRVMWTISRRRTHLLRLLVGWL